MNYIRDFSDGPNPTLFSALSSLGLLGNLELCLDAGDVNSAAAIDTGKWLDVSGNGYDFFRGDTTHDTGADLPTFNGMPGHKTREDYWSFDGADRFRYDVAPPSETWMQNLHKANATWTIVSWVYGPSNMLGIWGCTQAVSTNHGMTFSLNNNGKPRVIVSNGTGAYAKNYQPNLPVPVNQWTMLSASEDDAGSSLIMGVDNDFDTSDGSLASPSATNHSTRYDIAARGGGNNAMLSGSRMAMFAAWSRALSQAEMSSVYRATRHRFNR